MRHIVFLAVLSTTGFASAQPSEEAVKKEMKRFQGKWQAIAGQDLDGKKIGADELKKMTLEVEGNKFTIKNDGTPSIDGTFTVDPTKKIKTIDVSIEVSKDKAVLGIYEIKGDTRKSCFAEPGKSRPDGFRKEKGYIYLEWKLVK